MIKKTLVFSNPSYLKTKDEQLVFESAETGEVRSVPIEDIGIVILEHPQITISSGLLAKLVANNAAVVSCDEKHLPNGLFMPLSGHTIQTLRMRAQIEASAPLIKQLWQQTVQAKIDNQAAHLESRKVDVKNMKHWATSVRSGDPDNFEARAAAYYWSRLFAEKGSDNEEINELNFENFKRERYGVAPNSYLNYTYSILRACVARALVGSGLLPTFGIHHRNQYNAYCLADDIMEPYRPYADKLVMELLRDSASPLNIEKPEGGELTPKIKQYLLKLPVIDVNIEGKRSPLMVGLQTTTASLAACFEKKSRLICYPEM